MHESVSERLSRVSLRTKITGVTVLMLTLGLLVSGIGTAATLRQYVEDQVDVRLSTVAQGDLSRFFDSDGNATVPQVRSEAANSDYFVAAFDSDGTLITSNWHARDTADMPLMPKLSLATAYVVRGTVLNLHDQSGSDYHAMAVPITIDSTETGTALVAVSMRETDNIMATYLSIFLGFGVGVVILGALITRMLVTTTFTPLREVEQTAAAIADGDFSQRLGGATPNTEVGRLNRSLNTMLNRIDRAFKDRARSVDQMRRFVGDASHELRTPLVSVRGYAELYRMGALQTPEEIGQAMERIEKEAIRMGGLVEDLLSLARLDETQPLTVASVDLVPLARDAALDAMASAPDRTITVVVNPAEESRLLGEDLVLSAAGAGPQAVTAPTLVAQSATGPISFAGATLARLRGRRYRRADAEAVATGTIVASVMSSVEAQPAIVSADENKIRQMLTNLLGNAVRYSPAGTPIEIGVRIDEDAERAVLSIIDHGEGIAPQIREKIFQRFWRADTSRARETGGSGLGLAIVSSIVAAHNGSVDVTDTPGGGATFRVSLPLASSTASPRPSDSPA